MDLRAVRPRSNPSVTPGEPPLPAIAGWTGEAPADVDDDVPNIRVSILQCYRLRRKFLGSPPDVIATVQLVTIDDAQVNDSSVGMVNIGSEVKTAARRNRNPSWTEHFGIRRKRNPEPYFVVVTIKDARKADALGYIGQAVVRLKDICDQPARHYFDANWPLHTKKSSAAGAIRLRFMIEGVGPEPSSLILTASDLLNFLNITTTSALRDAAERDGRDAAGPAADAAASPVADTSTPANPGGSDDPGLAWVSEQIAEIRALRAELADGGAATAGPAAAPPPAASASHGQPSDAAGGPNLQCPLPPNWVMSKTAKGKVFFVDHAKRTTTFKDPRQNPEFAAYYATRRAETNAPRIATAANLEPVEDLGPLPDEWEERIDVDGRRFYVDHKKKKTSWYDPRDGKKSKRVDLNAATVPYSREYKMKLKSFRASMGNPRDHGKVNILLSRNDVLNTSYTAIMNLKGEELQKIPYISFHGEKGLDYGGLQREWLYLLSHEVFDPSHCLFEYCNENVYTLQVNKNSGINEQHLSYFRFIGRILAIAIMHGKHVDAFFIRPFYKTLLGIPIKVADMEVVDPAFYNSLKYVLENDPADLGLYFQVDERAFGETTSHELVPGGDDKEVTVENREEYVKLVIERRFVGTCKEQMGALRQGMEDIFPISKLVVFDEKELELLIGGIAEIDVKDWSKNTTYSAGYDSYSPTIQWFWETVLSFSPEQRARLLQFATGTSRVPMNGFSELQGSTGPQLFCVKQWGKIQDLPRAHTCFNRIDLPAYNSYQLVREKLLMAVENSEGFGGVD